MEFETPFIPEMSEIPQEYIRLWEKHNQSPVEKRVWEDVIALAKEEETSDVSKKGIYGQVPLESLLDLADRARAEPDPSKKYELLLEESTPGALWFDTLDGLRYEATVDELAKKIGERHWGTGLDLGTGSGSLSQKIEGSVDQLVGVDRVSMLTRLAQERRVGQEQFVVADALKLPFGDQSFDLATSVGLIGSLNKEQVAKYASELGRVIKPQGSYFEVFLLPTQEGIHLEQRRSLANAKGILADLIVDEVSGSAKIEDPFNFGDLRNIFQGFQLSMTMNEQRSIGVLEFKKNPL